METHTIKDMRNALLCAARKKWSLLSQLVFTVLVRLQCTGREPDNKGEPANKGGGCLVSAPATSETSIKINDLKF